MLGARAAEVLSHIAHWAVVKADLRRQACRWA